MNLAQLYYFRTLAQYEHYGKAAKSLYITQPSLSNSIKSLENELGVPLFERVGRSTRLTNYGKEFNDHICVALKEIDKAVEAMREYNSKTSGHIRIGVVPSLQRGYLPRLLSMFKGAFGNDMTFDIYSGTTYECIRGLNDGKYDLVFCGKLESPNRNITFVPQLSQNAVLAVNSNHPFAKRNAISLQELRNEKVITYRPGSYAHTALKGLFQSYGIKFDSRFDEELTAAFLIASDSTSVAIILETLDGFSLENFTTVPIAELRDPFHIVYLGYDKKTFHSHLANEFIRFTQRHIKFPAGIMPLEDYYLK